MRGKENSKTSRAVKQSEQKAETSDMGFVALAVWRRRAELMDGWRQCLEQRG